MCLPLNSNKTEMEEDSERKWEREWHEWMNEYHVRHTMMQLNSLTTKLEEKLDVVRIELFFSRQIGERVRAHIAHVRRI